MALRIPWDIEEAVLMLDMLLKSLDGKLTRKEAIHQVSEKLRRRAVNRGIEIDDIFRNENGITFQMSALEVAYTGIKTKLKQPTKLFMETVNLYRNHREFLIKYLRRLRTWLGQSLCRMNSVHIFRCKCRRFSCQMRI